jgi:hypothetical protein
MEYQDYEYQALRISAPSSLTTFCSATSKLIKRWTLHIRLWKRQDFQVAKESSTHCALCVESNEEEKKALEKRSY